MKTWKQITIIGILAILAIIVTACIPKKSETQSVQNEYDKNINGEYYQETEFQPQTLTVNEISTQVKTDDVLNSIVELRIGYFVGWDNDPSYDTLILSSAIGNSGIIATLPEVLDARFFNEENVAHFIGDRNSNHFVFNHIRGYDSNGSYVGDFRLHDNSNIRLVYQDWDVNREYPDAEGNNYFIVFWYTDRDNIINGRHEGHQSYNLNLKRGWNIVYNDGIQPSGIGDYTTTAPSGFNVKWQFTAREGSYDDRVVVNMSIGIGDTGIIYELTDFNQ